MKNEGGYLDSPSADEATAGSQVVVDGIIVLDRAAQLQRGLKSRHIQFMALGGAYVLPPSPFFSTNYPLLTPVWTASEPVFSSGLAGSWPW
jgi:hypothetical protein